MAAIRWVLVALSLTAAAGAQTVDEDWLIERLDRDVALDAATSVALRNDFGDLRVRTANDDRVAISGIVQRHRDDGDRPSLSIASADGRLTIEVRYPRPAPSDDPVLAKRRADITVFVPKGPKLQLATDAGLLNVRSANDMVLHTRSGTIDVKTGGVLEARSERGDVLAVLSRGTWPAPPRIETTTGDIELWLLRDASVAVDIVTGGWITTDFSIEVAHDDATALRHAKARLGKGEGSLFVRSTNGQVRLLRSP